MSRAALTLLFGTLALATTAHAQDACSSNSQCSPYEVCTTSFGECGSGAGNLDVCTGTCQPGQRFRFVPSLGAVGAASNHRAVGFPLAGLEVIPPILWGRLSANAELWSLAGGRVGLGSPWPFLGAFLLTPRIDGLFSSRGFIEASASLRLDYFPSFPFRSWTPAHYFSLAVEAGSTLVGPFPFLGASLRLWL